MDIDDQRFGFLSDQQKLELSRHFDKPHQTAMSHQLAVLLGIRNSEALSILDLLSSSPLYETKLLIYHQCAEAPIDAMVFSTEFPSIPYCCPHCQEIVEDSSELSYDVMVVSLAVTHNTIRRSSINRNNHT